MERFEGTLRNRVHLERVLSKLSDSLHYTPEFEEAWVDWRRSNGATIEGGFGFERPYEGSRGGMLYSVPRAGEKRLWGDAPDAFHLRLGVIGGTVLHSSRQVRGEECGIEGSRSRRVSEALARGKACLFQAFRDFDRQLIAKLEAAGHSDLVDKVFGSEETVMVPNCGKGDDFLEEIVRRPGVSKNGEALPEDASEWTEKLYDIHLPSDGDGFGFFHLGFLRVSQPPHAPQYDPSDKYRLARLPAYVSTSGSPIQHAVELYKGDSGGKRAETKGTIQQLPTRSRTVMFWKSSVANEFSFLGEVLGVLIRFCSDCSR